MAYTIFDARQVVLENLDDETGVRFARLPGTNTASYVKIDRALRGACSSCLDDYRGDRFDETIEVSTSSVGVVSLAAYQIQQVKGVRVDTGATTYRIEPGDLASGGRPDNTARDLLVTITRMFPIPATPATTDLLMGTVDGAARSWDAFDEWVCARASDSLGAKTDETRAAIQRNIKRLEESVKGHKRIPASKPWPERRVDGALYAARLRWLWDARAASFSLVFADRVTG